jgi:hypothetical protein
VSEKEEKIGLPCTTSILRVCRKLDLDSVDTIDAIEEEDKDEDECNLHSFASGNLLGGKSMPVNYLHGILYLRYKWTLGDEGEELSLQFVRKWDDEAHKDDHLGHEQEEDLPIPWLAILFVDTAPDGRNRRVDEGGHLVDYERGWNRESWEKVTRL